MKTKHSHLIIILAILNCLLIFNTCYAQIITTIAGNGIAGFSGDSGLAVSAQFNVPCEIAIDKAGNLYILDLYNYRIRRINTAGIINTVAGNGTKGYSGNGGPATSAEIDPGGGIAIDTAGNLYYSNYNKGRVCMVNSSGIINSIAGGGNCSGISCGDGGPADSATIDGPCGLAVDMRGNLYITDYFGQRVRVVDTSHIINTVAGNGYGAGSWWGGYSGDGGPATAAALNRPNNVCLDAAGNLYIADYGNSRIRMVNISGIITTIAGNGTNGFSGDGGLAISAEICPSLGVVDTAGNLYLPDDLHNRIRRVSTSGIITTVVGNGIQGFSGDGGLAINAELNQPNAVALDNAGNLYIADCFNNRIRKVTNVITIGTEQSSIGSEQISVYPNPAKNRIQVSSGGHKIILISIYDMLGKEMISTTEKEIDVSKLPEGVYFMQVKTSEGLFTKKVIIQR